VPRTFDRFRNHGSATALRGSAGLIAVFVSDPGASTPWDHAARASVERHIDAATSWIETQAARYGTALRFRRHSAPGQEASVAVDGRINETDLTAGPHHSTWQNAATVRLFQSAGLWVGTAWPRFRALLGEDELSSMALIFFVRRIYPSIAFPFEPGQDAEFEKERAIIYDTGTGGQIHLASLIAHEVLHLYGAIDLVPDKVGPIEPPVVADAIIQRSNEHLADLMHTPTQRPIEEYVASDLTAYLVGWRDAAPEWLPSAL
jgi:hypothetical protein